MWEGTGYALGVGVRVDAWMSSFEKFSLKPNPSSSQSTVVFFSPKTEVKRNVQKFHVLTGKKILKGNVI